MKFMCYDCIQITEFEDYVILEKQVDFWTIKRQFNLFKQRLDLLAIRKTFYMWTNKCPTISNIEAISVISGPIADLLSGWPLWHFYGKRTANPCGGLLLWPGILVWSLCPKVRSLCDCDGRHMFYDLGCWSAALFMQITSCQTIGLDVRTLSRIPPRFAV